MYLRKKMSVLLCASLLIFSVYVGRISQDVAAVVEYRDDVPVLIEPTGDQVWSAVAIDTGQVPHVIHVVWEDYRTGEPDIYYGRSEDGGKTFGNYLMVNDVSTGVQRQPDIAIDGNRNIHVVWSDERDPLPPNDKTQIYYARLPFPWVDFEDDIMVSENTGIPYDSPFGLLKAGASIAIDAGCDIHVSWYINEAIDFVSVNHGIFYDKDDDDCDGTSFGNDKQLNLDGIHPSVAIDSSDNPHIAYVVSGNRKVVHIRSNNGGNSFRSETQVLDASGTWGTEPSMDIFPGDPEDFVHIAWQDFRNTVSDMNYDIYYAKSTDNGDSWGMNIRVDDDTTNSGQGNPSLGVDEAGNPHVVWTDYRNDDDQWFEYDGGSDGVNNADIYYDSSLDGGATFGADMRISDDSVPGEDLEQSDPDVSIIGGSGFSTNVHVVWQDERSGEFDIYYDRSNDPPTLEWCGPPEFDNDGVDPDIGDPSTWFTYCIIYKDPDNDAPQTGFPEVHILDGSSVTPYTMTPGDWVVDPGDYRSGRKYTHQIQLGAGPDYQYYFWGRDEPGLDVLTPTLDGPVVTLPNDPPILEWCGDPGFESDGVHPDSGDPSTLFTYCIIYKDTDNDPPASGYPEVHILDGASDTPYEMIPGEWVGQENDYTMGRKFTYGTQLAAGPDYQYYFWAFDDRGLDAMTPIMDGPIVTVPNDPPVLEWCGTPGFETDGVNPDSGDPSTPFTYCIIYKDPEGDAPMANNPKVNILKSGMSIPGSPFTMEWIDWVNPGNPGYVDGAFFEYQTTLSAGTDYSYFFQVLNVVLQSASTPELDGPDVIAVNNPPELVWCGPPGFESDGVDPDSGDTTTSFTYCIIYRDQDNDAISSGWPKVHILKDGNDIPGSPFTMFIVGWVSGTPGDYVEGVIFKYWTTLSVAGTDYTYYFEAWNEAGQQAVTPEMDGPDVFGTNAPTLEWCVPPGFVDDGVDPDVGGTPQVFTYCIIYKDQDNERPADEYPKVYIKKAGVDIPGSPFTMEWGNWMIDPDDWVTGAWYHYDIQFTQPGTDYTYVFEAEDIGGMTAQTPEMDGPRVYDCDDDWWTYHHDGWHSGLTSCVGWIINPTQEKWSQPIGTDIQDPVVGDIDDDGEPEIIIPGSDYIAYYVYALNGNDGTEEWSFPTDGRAGYMSLGDIDVDGSIEVVFGTSTGHIYALNGEDGTVQWSYEVTEQWAMYSAPAIGNTDDETDIEVVIGAGDSISQSKLYVFYGVGNPDGTGRVKRSFDFEGWWGTVSSPSIADVDYDTVTEILVSLTTVFSQGFLYCLDGRDLSIEWMYTEGSRSMTTVSLGNIDNDDALEVVIAGSDMGGGYVTALDGRGTPSGGGKVQWTNTDPTDQVEMAPSLGDIDDDGDVEVVVASDDNSIYVLDGRNRGRLEWKYTTNGMTPFPATLADIDADGDLEVLVGSFDHFLYVLSGEDIGGDGIGDVEWTFNALGDIWSGITVDDIDNDELAEIIFVALVPFIGSKTWCLDTV